MSRRLEKLSSQIRRLIADALARRISDPRIEPLTSITRVAVSPDLALARIYVCVFAPPGRQRACLAALQHAAGHLRTLLAQELSVRQTPELRFFLDDSLKKAAETVQIIEQSVESGPGDRPVSAADETQTDESGDADEAAPPADWKE